MISPLIYWEMCSKFILLYFMANCTLNYSPLKADGIQAKIFHILQITMVKKNSDYSQKPMNEQTLQGLKCHLLADILTESVSKYCDN